MRYEPTPDSIRQHQAPEWYHDAKFGIFIHWGPFSVPAYAPLGHGDINELMVKEGYASFFTNIPYSEWYVNSIRIQGSPAHEHHRRTYGQDASYFDFAPQFKRASANWQPEPWADLFQAAGARYVVLVTKHMDGFLMWPSRTPNYARPDYHMDRDVVGELTAAVKARGMRMGFYYSSALDQSFTTSAMTDIAGLFSEGGPIDQRYAQYQFGHWRELIDRYAPVHPVGRHRVPAGHEPVRAVRLLLQPDPGGRRQRSLGAVPVVDAPADPDAPRPRAAQRVRHAHAQAGQRRQRETAALRFPHARVRGHEGYQPGEVGNLPRHGAWLRLSTARKATTTIIKLPELIRMLVDIVSKNGNLLLNVGPMPDGTIPPVQADLLRGVGAWLKTYGEAIYGTRPWQRAEGITTDRRGGALHPAAVGTGRNAVRPLHGPAARPAGDDQRPARRPGRRHLRSRYRAAR